METTVTKPTLNGLNELYKFINTQDNNLVLVNGMIEPSLTKLSAIKDFYTITNENRKTIITVKKKVIAPLLTIINYTSSESEGTNHTAIEFNGEELSDSKILAIDLSFFDTHYVKNSTININLNKSAKLTHALINLENENSKNYTKLNARLQHHSAYHSLLLSIGGLFTEIQTSIDLIEAGALTTLNGLYATKDLMKAHFLTTINHHAPHTESDQLYKGILDGESRAKFQGKVFVAPHAQLIRSSQLNKNLLLSKKAQIDSEPQLEIYADDVKCNHGATIGNLDDDQIFYFESRGIAKNKARRMLTHAFANDIFMKSSDKVIATRLEKIFMTYFEKKVTL